MEWDAIAEIIVAVDPIKFGSPWQAIIGNGRGYSPKNIENPMDRHELARIKRHIVPNRFAF